MKKQNIVILIICFLVIIALFIILKIAFTGKIVQEEANDESLVLNMGFNEGSGAIAYDYSGEENNGVINGVSWKSEADCIAGSCLSFENIVNYIEVPYSNSLNLISQGTIEFWIKPKWNGNDGKFHSFFNNMESGSKNRIAFGKLTTGNLYFWIFDNNGIVSGVSLNVSDWQSGVWRHLAASWDKDALRLFVNGKYLNSSFVVEMPSARENSIFIGATNSAGYYSSDAIIDEFKIYNKSLSAYDIKNKFKQSYKIQYGFCGNGVCEPNRSETAESCAQDCPKEICNHNGKCEGVENQANCLSDCWGKCISPEYKEIIDSIWKVKKQELINSINNNLQKANPYVLYDIQSQTNGLLKYSYYCRDYEKLNDLAEVYLTSYNYLNDTSAKYPGYKVWICGSPSCNNWPASKNDEVFLCSSQYNALISEAINIITKIPEDKRTNAMEELVAKFTPVLLRDHYERWYPVGYKTLEDKYNKTYWNAYPSSSAFNAITDKELWIIDGVLQMLDAQNKEPELINMSDEQKIKFTNFVSLGSKMVESRLSESNLTDFYGNSIKGINFDLGGIGNHYSEGPYSCYDGEIFPEVIRDKQECENLGWDIGHASRFIHFFIALYDYKYLTNRDFPDENILKGLTNQFVYGVFNKDFANPLFNNYMDGTSGWYRVGYQGRSNFGYAPYMLSQGALDYNFWSKYNGDMSKITNSLWNLILLLRISDTSGEGNNCVSYGANWVDGKIGRALSFDGVENYMDCGKDISFKSEKGTIAFWFKSNTVFTNNDIVNIYEDGYYNYLLVRRTSDNKIRFAIEDNDAAKISLLSTISIADTSWHHIAITQDGSGAKIYIDGADSQATGTNSEFWTSHLSLSGFWIGKGHWSNLNGLIDDVRIYNRALSVNEILALNSTNSQSVNTKELIGYWNFDDEQQTEKTKADIDFVNKYYSIYPSLDSISTLIFLPSMATENYCGNSICGLDENCSSCSYDCGSCVENCLTKWTCTEWDICLAAGFQIRTCSYPTGQCKPEVIEPIETQDCTYSSSSTNANAEPNVEENPPSGNQTTVPKKQTMTFVTILPIVIFLVIIFLIAILLALIKKSRD